MVRLGTLYAVTSRKGVKYFRGRLGDANIMIFRDDEPNEQGQTTYGAYIAERREYKIERPNAGNGAEGRREREELARQQVTAAITGTPPANEPEPGIVSCGEPGGVQLRGQRETDDEMNDAVPF